MAKKNKAVSQPLTEEKEVQTNEVPAVEEVASKKSGKKASKKEEKLKNGTLVLDNYDFPHIILITCSKTKDNIQEIYYAKKVAIS